MHVIHARTRIFACPSRRCGRANIALRAESGPQGSSLKAQQQRWAKRQRFLRREPRLYDDDVIELNVGGKVMLTTRSTLLQVPGSRLHDMFARGSSSGGSGGGSGSTASTLMARDAQGRPFLDFEPASFALVLRFLRERKMKAGKDAASCLPPVHPHEAASFNLLLNYLRLLPPDGAAHALTPDAPPPSADLVLAGSSSNGSDSSDSNNSSNSGRCSTSAASSPSGCVATPGGAAAAAAAAAAGAAGATGTPCTSDSTVAASCHSGAGSGDNRTEGSIHRASTSSPSQSAADGSEQTLVPPTGSKARTTHSTDTLWPLQPQQLYHRPGQQHLHKVLAASKAGRLQPPLLGGGGGHGGGSGGGRDDKSVASRGLASSVQATPPTSQLFYIQAQYEQRRGVRVSVFTESDLRVMRLPQPCDVFCDCTWAANRITFTFVARTEFDNMFVGVTSRNQLDRRGAQIPCYGWKRDSAAPCVELAGPSGCTEDGSGGTSGGTSTAMRELLAAAMGLRRGSSSRPASSTDGSEGSGVFRKEDRVAAGVGSGGGVAQAERSAGTRGVGCGGGDKEADSHVPAVDAASADGEVAGAPAGGLWRKGDSVEVIVEADAQGTHNCMTLKVNGRERGCLPALPPVRHWSWYLALYTAGGDMSCVVLNQELYSVYWSDFRVSRFLA